MTPPTEKHRMGRSRHIWGVIALGTVAISLALLAHINWSKDPLRALDPIDIDVRGKIDLGKKTLPRLRLELDGDERAILTVPLTNTSQQFSLISASLAKGSFCTLGATVDQRHAPPRIDLPVRGQHVLVQNDQGHLEDTDIQDIVEFRSPYPKQQVDVDTSILSRDPSMSILWAYVACPLGTHALRTNFTGRALTVEALGSLDLDIGEFRLLPDFRVEGATPVQQGSFFVVPLKSNSVTLLWRDESSAQVRDTYLVLVGVLLGVAGACAVEWIKPRIEGSAQSS